MTTTPHRRMPFADLLRTRRDQLSLTQHDVARLAGVSRSLISRWENGHTEHPDKLDPVLRALGIPPADAYTALGLLPSEEPERSPFHDADERMIWNLGEQRNWDDSERLHLIAAWRSRNVLSDLLDEIAAGRDRSADVEEAVRIAEEIHDEATGVRKRHL